MTPRLTIDDLVGLELFLDVIRLGSISSAARTHHVSQPSATERLRRLERRLGVTLVRRGPGGSEPTEAGQAVAEWAREVLTAVDHLDTGVAALRSSDAARPLRIMASLTVAEYVIPRWLAAYRSAGGGPVELSVGNSVAVTRAVADRTVSLGFVESPRRFRAFKSAGVGGDRLVVVTAPDHPWARRRRPLDPGTLASTPLLTREVGSGTRDAYEAALARLGLEPAAPLAVLGSTTTLKAAVANGGVTVLSELAVAAELGSASLVEIPVEHLDLTRPFTALWRPDDTDPARARFIRTARSTFLPGQLLRGKI
jgi:molybdate transport repressor ModE-like protein